MAVHLQVVQALPYCLSHLRDCAPREEQGERSLQPQFFGPKVFLVSPETILKQPCTNDMKACLLVLLTWGRR